MQNRRICWLFCMLVFLVACGPSRQSAYSPLNKKSPAILQEEVALLQKILEANHPSLYWYTPKDSMDFYFKQARESITDSLNEIQFKNHVALLIAKIHCGHTTVRFSKDYRKTAAQFQFPAFPLSIKTWGDSMVVLGGSFAQKAVSKRGTIITSINGKTNREILDSIFPYISIDGYANNYRSQLVSNQFGAWYKTIFGLDSQYIIKYIDSTGMPAVDTLRNFNPGLRPSRRPIPNDSLARVVTRPSRKQIRAANKFNQRSLQIDTSINTAYLRITSFSAPGLRKFFKQSFKTIQEKHIPHLVIDLRENGGGQINNSIRLTAYLAKQPFKVADTVVAISRKFEYGSHIKQSWLYWFPMNFSAHKMEDGKIHYRRYETKQYEPNKHLRFDGDIYIVQGGLSFSAATMFAGNLKGQSNVTIVGEESGGGYYGNSALHLPTIVLPNTGLQISLPMYRIVLAGNRPKGLGVQPDLPVGPSSEAIRKGQDLKLLQIRKLIQAAKNPS